MKLNSALRICLVGLTFLFVTGLESGAQGLNDVWLYGRPDMAVTARSAGMAGANGALAGDYGAVLVNPAAMGGIRKLTLGGTLGLVVNNRSNAYLDRETPSGTARLPLSDLSIMVPLNASGSWQHSLGMGYSQNRNLAERWEYSAYNTETSLLHHWADEYNLGANLDDYGSGLAYDCDLIGPIDTSNPNSMLGTVLPNANIQQSEIRQSRGRQTELSFHWASSFEDILSIGASVGLRGLDYRWKSTYTENDLRDSIPDFDRFDYYRQLDVSGSGYFFRVGAQAQPLPWLRLGLAYSGRERTELSEDYQATMTSKWSNPTETLRSSSPSPDTVAPFVWNYKGSNRTTFSLAMFWGRNGLISVDYDWMGYGGMGVASAWDEQSLDYEISDWGKELNQTVRNSLQMGQQLRIGTEWVQGPAAFRAGYQWSSTPFVDELVERPWNQSRRQFTVGAGRKMGSMTLDVAAYWTETSASEQIYPMLAPEKGPVLRSTRTGFGLMCGVYYRL